VQADLRARMRSIVAALAIVAALPGTSAGQAVEARSDAVDRGHQSSAPAGAQDPPPRGFLSALAHNLLDDLRHLPRRNSVYWLAGGGALALAVHPADGDINAHLVNETTDALWTPGHIIGSPEVIFAGSSALYVIGRLAGAPRLRHLGMDEIEAALLAEAFTHGIKQIVRRDRPPQVEGDPTSSFSFPSGHAMMTFAAATVLQQHLGYRAAIPTYLVASYVAMSRLHDNRHFASDVVFGAALGIVIGRSVTWHGRNFYASPLLVPHGGGIALQLIR
jgi:membrane-associated phospholipid phosphatase